MPNDPSRPNFLAGPYLERRATLREQTDWLQQSISDPGTRVLVTRGTSQLLRAGEAPAVRFLRTAHELVRAFAAEPERWSLLGWYEGERCLTLDVDGDAALAADAAAWAARYPDLAADRFEELRPLAPLLEEREAALLAYVRALAHWKRQHRFCGVCGSPAAPARAGHVMKCRNPDCGRESFPRIDPAIIVLVTDAGGERALLGRQASWPAGRYSTIAGFVEPGESLEDAVAREVEEETGVRVRAERVRYHSSQPWPFPSSLMLGFHAVADDATIVLGDSELEDARWFTRADIASGVPMLPPRTSISHRLIETWFDAGSDVPLARQQNVGRWEARRA